MSMTFNTKTFTADSYEKDRIVYFGPAKTASLKDNVTLSRQAPKPTTSFSGMSRTSSKLVRTLTLTGALTSVGDAIVQIDVSVPVGTASADIDALLNDMGALLSGATMKTHVKSAQIAF